MQTVQIVLEKKLLQATDQAARRLKRNRSAFVREALREHLRRLDFKGSGRARSCRLFKTVPSSR